MRSEGQMHGQMVKHAHRQEQQETKQIAEKQPFPKLRILVYPFLPHHSISALRSRNEGRA
jgi:hypothetical protein